MSELSASLESGAIADELSSGHLVRAAASSPTVDSDDWARRVTNEQTKEVEQVAATPLSLNKNLTGCVPDNNRKSHGSDEGTSATVPPSTPVEGADTNGTKTFELMSANLNATLKYVQRLVNVTSAEVVDISSDHLRRHLGLMVEYTIAFSELSSQLMRSTLGTAEPARDEQRQPKLTTEER
jgi:hypothetical protein